MQRATGQWIQELGLLGGVGTMFWVGYMYRGISGGIVLILCTLGLTALFWFMVFALTE